MNLRDEAATHTWFLNNVLIEEVAQLARAPGHTRSSSGRAYQNGDRSRSLKTRFGEISLVKSQLGLIPFETKVFDRDFPPEKALVIVIIESYLPGVSTRNVENVVACLGVNQLSASYVSKAGWELDTKVEDFME